jgi:hypothetical protein
MHGNMKEISTFVPASPEDPEKYARESFTWRRMTQAQVRILTAISAALFGAAILSEIV